jgi:2-methylisocitrate lyase-like PEP mutase family enzyme
MPAQAALARRFLDLHAGEQPLLLPNPWDAGSAKLLASLGFEALATTSSGFAATLGRLDGSVTRDEALAHAAVMTGATELPVSADLENGFASDPEDVAETVRLAIEAGLAGCSIEDSTRDEASPIYDAGLAVERIAAAAQAAHDGPVHLVLTARAENHLHGRDDLDDLDDTIARLRAYGEAGADVLYAPGLVGIDDIRRVVAEVARPVNVLALPGVPSVASSPPRACGGSPWAGRSRSRRSGRSSRRPGSCARTGPTGISRARAPAARPRGRPSAPDPAPEALTSIAGARGRCAARRAYLEIQSSRRHHGV